jgi:hypothetical protein
VAIHSEDRQWFLCLLGTRPMHWQAWRQYVTYVARGHVAITIDSAAVHAEMVEAQDEETRTRIKLAEWCQTVSCISPCRPQYMSSVQILLMERGSRIKNTYLSLAARHSSQIAGVLVSAPSLAEIRLPIAQALASQLCKRGYTRMMQISQSPSCGPSNPISAALSGTSGNRISLLFSPHLDL